MKPPKSIRNFVHTILGTKKQSKNSLKSSVSLAEHTTNGREVLDKKSRHHRSADDLLDESQDFAVGRLPHVSNSGIRTLPRRSQSCLSVQRPSVVRAKGVYGVRVVSGVDESDQFESRERPRNNFEAQSGKTSSHITRSKSLHSVSRGEVPRRLHTQTPRGKQEWDEGYGDSLPRATSWSHAQQANQRYHYGGQAMPSRRPSERTVPEDECTGSTEPQAIAEDRRDRFECQDQLSRVSSHPCPRSTLSAERNSRSVSRSSANTSENSADKLKTCLYVLNRLSAQVEEIRDVSKRVNYVDKEVKTGALPNDERERRLKELDMAAAASQRLKALLKETKAENLLQGRNSSRCSSGYESSQGSRRTSNSTNSDEVVRTSRPPGRRQYDARYDYKHAMPHHAGYPDSQPYPQSVSDMMPLWDAKDAAAYQRQPRERNMTREDSMSSGYATGSGSEDGRHESPIANDADSVASVYSMQCVPVKPQYHHLQPGHENWKQQHYFERPLEGYNAADFAVYGSYHPAMSVDSAMGSAQENIYGEYHRYASSSLFDNDVYSNGWYRLPATDHRQPPVEYSTHVDHNPLPQYPSTQPQAWMQSSFVSHPVNSKYGGLSDIFYDPSAQPTPTIMDNVAKEIAKQSQVDDESTWKLYGSFRYRNGERTVTSATSRKRKTVRFSHTVRQRVETEESEMEDSTSVMKGGCDEEETVNPGNDVTSAVTKLDPALEHSDIYMWPRAQHEDNDQAQNASQSHKSLPEPIYEFPSGHIESSCMCGDCILARGSCQMQPAQVAAYY